jgi:hypothetical protein
MNTVIYHDAYSAYRNQLENDLVLIKHDLIDTVDSSIEFSTLDIKFSEIIRLRKLIKAVDRLIANKEYNARILTLMAEDKLTLKDIEGDKSISEEAIKLLKSYIETNNLKSPSPERLSGLAEELVIEASEQGISVEAALQRHQDQLQKALA